MYAHGKCEPKQRADKGRTTTKPDLSRTSDTRGHTDRQDDEMRPYDLR